MSMTNQQWAPEALRLPVQTLIELHQGLANNLHDGPARNLHLATVAALVEAQQPAPSAAADPQLLKFYGVTTDAELIAAQARHIERLQAKLPQNQSFAPQRVREG